MTLSVDRDSQEETFLFDFLYVDRPRMASPGVPLGKIHGDLAELEKLGAGVSAVLTNGPQDSR